jgi:hypothetical protein
MIWTGALTVAAALAAAWLGFAPIPKLSVRGKPPPTRPMIASWSEFSPRTLARAKKLDRLILLSLTARWSSQGRLMDGTAYADPQTALVLEKSLVAVRVDADERPDLALRYLGKGWPTTALLLPTGEVLADGTYMDGPTLRRWVETIGGRFRSRRAGVYDAQAQAQALRERKSSPAGDPAQELDRARRALVDTWSGPVVFARFDRLLALTRLRAAWAAPVARRGKLEALKLQDADGGFFRTSNDHEKRLGDQADALLFLSAAEPAAAARLRAFISKRLALPAGGYRASVWPEGRDERVFCDESARMAAAIISDPSASKAQRDHARLTIERLSALRSRPKDLLGDRLGAIEGLLAARRSRHAEASARALESLLLDEEGQAFYDRPKTGELAPGLDRIRFAGLNARARRVYAAAGLRRRAELLDQWLWEHPEGLDAADLAELAEAATSRTFSR